MNMSYLLLIAVTLILGLGTQAMIKSSFKKWSQVPSSSRLTGAQAARRMLDDHGLQAVQIQPVAGDLTDHYDPRSNVVSLSQSVYGVSSVAAVAVACHECGHAVQHAKNYVPARIRAAIVPAVSFASNVWVIVLMAGIFLTMVNLIYLAIALYLAVIAFQVVTLPVEFNASSRAIAYIEAYGHLPAAENAGTRKVLNSAAMTYVAAALSSLLYLIWLLGFARR